jgi:hypothetical protein
LETGAAGGGELQGARDGRDGRARQNGHRKPDVDGDASASGLGASSEIFWILREGDARRDGRVHRPWLCEHWIADGEVIEEGFVGPLARLVGRGGIGRVSRRGEAGRCGREAEMIEDLPDDRRPLDTNPGNPERRPAPVRAGVEARRARDSRFVNNAC